MRSKKQIMEEMKNKCTCNETSFLVEALLDIRDLLKEAKKK